MADEERVVLNAELRDELSAPLERLQREVKDTADTVEKSNNRQERSSKDALSSIRRQMDAAGRSSSKMADQFERATGRGGNAFQRMMRKVNHSSVGKAWTSFEKKATRSLDAVQRKVRSTNVDLNQMAHDISNTGSFGGRAFTKFALVATGALSVVPPLLGAIGAAGLAAVGNIVTLAGSIGVLAGAAVAVPGLLAGTAAAGGVLSIALKGAAKRLKDLLPLWEDFKKSIRDDFWDAAEGPLRNLISTLLPDVTAGVAGIAREWGQVAKWATFALTDALDDGVLASWLQTTADAVNGAQVGAMHLANAFVVLGGVGIKYLPRMTRWVSDLSVKFNYFLMDAEGDGRLKGWIDAGIRGFKDLGSVIGSTFSIFGAINDAAIAGGAQSTLNGLAEGMRRVAAVMNGPAFQTTLATLFRGSEAGAQALLDALVPIGAAFKRGADNMATFLRLGGEITGIFTGGVFTALSNPKFGSGLNTFLRAVKAGVQAIVPLLPQLTTAWGQVLTAMAPIVQVLGPNLVKAFAGMARGIAQLITFFSPFLEMLASSPVILGILIGAFFATRAAAAALTAAANIQKVAMIAWKTVTGTVAVVQGVLSAALGLSTRRIAKNTVAMRAYSITMGVMKVATIATTITTRALGAAWRFMLGPIGWIITAVGLLVTGLVWFFTQTEVGQRIVQAAWAGIKRAAAAVVTWFQTVAVPFMKSAWDSIAAGAMWLYTNGIRPAFEGVMSVVRAAADVFQWLYRSIVKPVFNFMFVVIRGFWMLARGIFQLVVAFVRKVLAPAFQWFWTGIVKPVFRSIGTTISRWWAVAKALFQGAITFLRVHVGAVFTWLWKSKVQPVFRLISTATKVMWERHVAPIFRAVRNYIRDVLGPAFRWLQEHTKAVWDTIGTVIKAVWTKRVKPVFDTLNHWITEVIPKAFRLGVRLISELWGKVKAAAAAPINFVIDTIINKGVIGTFNKLARKLGVDELPKVHNPLKGAGASGGNATGGPMRFYAEGGYTGDGPKYKPAGIVHRGEYVVNKAQTAAAGGPQGVEHALAARGGAGFSPVFWGPFQAAIRAANRLSVIGNPPGWSVPSAAGMWDNLAGLDVGYGRGNPQARVSGGNLNWMNYPGIAGYAYSNGNIVLNQGNPNLSPTLKRAVAAHEIGHVLGLPHTNGPSIMQPSVSTYMQPTAMDKQRLEALYGAGSRAPGGAGGGFDPLGWIVEKVTGALKGLLQNIPGAGGFLDIAVSFGKKLFTGVVDWVKDKIGMAATVNPMAPAVFDNGGTLGPGLNLINNATGAPEHLRPVGRGERGGGTTVQVDVKIEVRADSEGKVDLDDLEEQIDEIFRKHERRDY